MDVIAAPNAAAAGLPIPGAPSAGTGEGFAALLALAVLAGDGTPAAAPEAEVAEAAPLQDTPAGSIRAVSLPPSPAPPAARLPPVATPTAAPAVDDAALPGVIVPATPPPRLAEGDCQQPQGAASDGLPPREVAPELDDPAEGTATPLDAPPLPDAIVVPRPACATPTEPASPADQVPAAQTPVRRGGGSPGEGVTAATPQAPSAGNGRVPANLEAVDGAPPTNGETPSRPTMPHRAVPAPTASMHDGARPIAPTAPIRPDVSAAAPRLPTTIEAPVLHDAPVPSSAPAGAATGTDPLSVPVNGAALPAPAKPATDTAQPAPTRPAAPTTPPARQIAPVIVAVAIGGGTARLAVTLEPAELGRVEISVERSGDTSQVQILAERPETLALLQRDQRELDRALSQTGVATEGRSVSLGLASDGGAGQQAWQDRRDARPGPRRIADVTAPAAEPRRAVLSLLDLAV